MDGGQPRMQAGRIGGRRQHQSTSFLSSLRALRLRDVYTVITSSKSMTVDVSIGLLYAITDISTRL